MLSDNTKIILLNTSAKISGAERSLIDVLNVLSPDLTPIVILPYKDELYKLLEATVNIEIVELIRLKRGKGIISISKDIFNILKHTYKISQLIKIDGIKIIYSNTISAQLYAVLLKFLTGRPIVWHVRDNLNNKFFSFLFSILSDKILCISEHILQQVPFKKKAELVYNGIDTEVWKIDSIFETKIKAELGLDRNAILVGHIGQLIPWKRHDLFIEVAGHIVFNTEENVHFVIVGDDLFNDFPEYKSDLQQRIASKNLGNRISFLEYKSNFIEYLNGIDIVLHLADEEPFGRVLIEAMALEKPIIARSEGGPKEIVNDNISGFLVTLPDPATIAHKLRILINNPHLRNQFGKEGRKIVENKFSIKNLHKINTIISSMHEKYSN